MAVWAQESRSDPGLVNRLSSEEDAVYMRRAIQLAERGRGQVAPNPLVGAVIVREGRLVGEGWHARFGGPHAEVVALDAAGDEARGATLYVSLEPCAHHGKTGPCTQAILAHGIERVVYAAPDPDPKAAGGGEMLSRSGVQVTSGIEADAAKSINGRFFRAHSRSAPDRPWTELKLAISLDGGVADRDGHSTWITGDESRAEVHRLRSGHDAIAVGIATALADDPILTVRGEIEPRIPPARVVFDRAARLPLTSRLVQSAREIPVSVVCAPDAPAASRRDLEGEGVRVVEATDITAALAALRSGGIESLFCEGGARIASVLLGADLVDRLTLFIAPILLGPDAIGPFREIPSTPLAEAHRWRLVSSRTFGPDTVICVEP
ncbi:MAG: bifunctional diaminohydroxyphosphoribosylaminopyrimidine deaminase/5-amino-6-(5-phosphoribosylamino)uracil reductase RibD [Gemmatimonas sp.]|nr:bifunctional diaminohydroxyphosphoribosylaminopyrimidine deaminase/5-amino-6-(5-phosphoribosylamino)uracil reductase RibD [Gemmatimonas sp.]